MRSIFTRMPLALALLLLPSLEGTARADARDHLAWIHVGGAYAGAKTDLADARGRRIVATHANVAPSTLVTTGTDRFADGETIIRYAQSYRGLPVIGRGASVRLSAAGQPVVTVTDLESELPARTTAKVTVNDAVLVASGRTAFGAAAAAAEDAHLVIWPTADRGARLAWAVLPRVPGGVPTRPRVIVDADTGEVLEVRDMVTYAKANVFLSNPSKTPNATLIDLPLATSDATLTNAFVQASNCVDNKTVKPVAFFGFNLNVHVCDLVHVAAADPSGDFVYTPSDEAGSAEARTDAFSEVSMYFHASKAYAFFRELQGDPDAQVVVDKPLRVIANLQIPAGLMTGDLAKAADPNLPLETFQNAFFAPAGGGLGSIFQQLYGFESGALWFGQGPKRDYAYDGDVVYHELTHAVVDATLKLGAWHVDAYGTIDAPGAMNEGLADYFSSAITGDPNVGEYAAADMGVADGAPIRTLDNQDRCSGLVGEVHLDSTLFSGALWAARTSLAESDRPKFDGALYKAMRSNPEGGDLGFEDLAKLFVTTLATDLPAGATALEKSMNERSLLVGCDRIEAYTGTPRRSRDARIGFAAPGKTAVSVKGMAPGIFQLAADLPERTTAMTVSFAARSRAAQNPLGGAATPFSPVVLAKIGEPVRWDPKSKNGHDASFKVVGKESGGTVSVTVEIPEGTPAGKIYVQIANSGDSDGSYDDVGLTFASSGGAEPVVEYPPAPESTAPPADDGCSASNRKASAALLPGMLGALGIVSVLRRRRRG